MYAAIEILPGPGDYEVKTAREGPQVIIGQITRCPFKNEAPPPNAYFIKSGIGANAVHERSAPSATLKSRLPPGSNQYPMIKAGVPSPASYTIPDVRVVVPSFGKRYPMVEYNSAKIVPGPGTYNPEMSESLTQLSAGSRGRTMGIKHSQCVMPLITLHDIIF